MSTKKIPEGLIKFSFTLSVRLIIKKWPQDHFLAKAETGCSCRCIVRPPKWKWNADWPADQVYALNGSFGFRSRIWLLILQFLFIAFLLLFVLSNQRSNTF